MQAYFFLCILRSFKNGLFGVSMSLDGFRGSFSRGRGIDGTLKDPGQRIHATLRCSAGDAYLVDPELKSCLTAASP